MTPLALARSARWAPALVIAAVIGASSVGGVGCKTSCSDEVNSDPVDVPLCSDGGSAPCGRTNASRTLYESAAWDAPYLTFEPQRRYRLHHGLGKAPVLVQAFVGFHSKDGTKPEAPLPGTSPGNVSEATGNEAIIEIVDAELIQVRNDTCETFVLRVAASASADGDEPSSADANGAAGAATQ